MFVTSTNGLIFIVSGVLLFSNVFEAYFQQSFRLPLSAICIILISQCFLIKPKIHRNVLIYVISVLIYLDIYYLFGSGDYRIIHVYTILIGAALLYNVMVAANYSSEEIWGLCKLIWITIYITLLGELLFVVLGHQQFLYDIFPESINKPKGLPSYRIIHNTFANFFGLDYNGLNSIILSAQSYGQLCITLTVFSFKLSGIRNKEFLKYSILFILLPVLLYVISPNITGVIVLFSIMFCNVLIKQYIGMYSKPRTLIAMSLVVVLVTVFFIADIGFVRRYDWGEFYLDYVSPQINYVLNKNFSEYIIGADPKGFREVIDQSEIGALSYASAVGMIFLSLNLVLLLYFMCRNLIQIKTLYLRKLCKVDYLEMQIKNLLLIVAMLVSTIHFPILFDFVVSLLFILNVSFCIYSVNNNMKIIAGGARAPREIR